MDNLLPLSLVWHCVEELLPQVSTDVPSGQN